MTILRRVMQAGAAIAALALVFIVWPRLAPRDVPSAKDAPTLGAPGSPSTTRDDLARTVSAMEARLARKPDDTTAAATLADALLRQARVASNPGLAVRAEAALHAVLAAKPDDYDAHRMLGAVYLSQHRFREAIREAEHCQTVRPDDAWVYGVMGDGHLELGEYADAFAAFDRMAALRPNAASYARSSYAHELQGDLPGAIRLMMMSAEATGAQDPESQAWHYAQLGHLYFDSGRLDLAKREYEHAAYVFPGHPFATDGLARVAAANGDLAGALEMVTRQLDTAPTPSEAALAGDLLEALGRHDDAERQYALAEAGWRVDAPEPKALVRFLADRDRKLDEAIRIAEHEATIRQDIWTDDALAWAYFKGGRVADAARASAQALRTGSTDREILYHAAAIKHAQGADQDARALVGAALAGNPRFDLVIAPAAARLYDELSRAPQVAAR